MITKGFRILTEIQKLVLLSDKGNENQINILTNDLYSTVPHNFGVKKPVMIDHPLRIKEKAKMME